MAGAPALTRIIKKEEGSFHSIARKLKRKYDQDEEYLHGAETDLPQHVVKEEPQQYAPYHYQSSQYSNSLYSCSSGNGRPINIKNDKNAESSTNEPVYATELRLTKVQSLNETNSHAAALLQIEVLLADELSRLDYGDKVTHLYNPVDYAFLPHFEYYKKYCCNTAEVIFVGMNPGPFGMAQSGVSIVI